MTLEWDSLRANMMSSTLALTASDTAALSHAAAPMNELAPPSSAPPPSSAQQHYSSAHTPSPYEGVRPTPRNPYASYASTPQHYAATPHPVVPFDGTAQAGMMGAISRELESLAGSLTASISEVMTAARDTQHQLELLSAAHSTSARRTAELEERQQDLEAVGRRTQLRWDDSAGAIAGLGAWRQQVEASLGNVAQQFAAIHRQLSGIQLALQVRSRWKVLV